MTRNSAADNLEVVEVINPDGASPIVLVCEHASAHIPDIFQGLGLSEEAQASHAAWDPGAEAVARVMATELDAALVSARVSRLVYDNNRPPNARAAMPERSEIYDVPGNANLSSDDWAARVDAYYTPFQKQVAETLAQRRSPLVVTIHSFTPIFHGQRRAVEIGVLHDEDTRLADAMLATAEAIDDHIIRRNEPYGPEDGVTHTLQKHGVDHGRPNVMIEVRNDLIASQTEQRDMGRELAGWVATAAAQVTGADTCKA